MWCFSKNIFHEVNTHWAKRIAIILVLAGFASPRGFAQQSEFPPLPAPVQAPVVDVAVDADDFRIWTSEDGLISNSIRAMAQTPDGYLWFGTHSGLSRFDGKRFVNFDPKSDPRLPGGNVSSLLADDNNQLFVAVKGAGLFVYDGTAFNPVPGNDKLRELMADGDWIDGLQSGDDESMWFRVGTSSLVRLHSDGRIERWPATLFARPDSEVGGNPNWLTATSPLPDGGLLVPSTQGLSRFQPDTGVSASLPINTAHKYIQ